MSRRFSREVKAWLAGIVAQDPYLAVYEIMKACSLLDLRYSRYTEARRIDRAAGDYNPGFDVAIAQDDTFRLSIVANEVQ